MTGVRWISLMAVVALSACSGSKEAEPAAPPITYQEMPAPPSQAAKHEPTAVEVPVAEDFDEASEAEINADNFKQELDRLEAEINADNGR